MCATQQLKVRPQVTRDCVLVQRGNAVDNYVGRHGQNPLLLIGTHSLLSMLGIRSDPVIIIEVSSESRIAREQYVTPIRRVPESLARHRSSSNLLMSMVD